MLMDKRLYLTAQSGNAQAAPDTAVFDLHLCELRVYVEATPGEGCSFRVHCQILCLVLLVQRLARVFVGKYFELYTV